MFLCFFVISPNSIWTQKEITKENNKYSSGPQSLQLFRAQMRILDCPFKLYLQRALEIFAENVRTVNSVPTHGCASTWKIATLNSWLAQLEYQFTTYCRFDIYLPLTGICAPQIESKHANGGFFYLPEIVGHKVCFSVFGFPQQEGVSQSTGFMGKGCGKIWKWFRWLRFFHFGGLEL